MNDEHDIPTYGLLLINHAYNEGALSFKEWLCLSREWAMQMAERYGEGTACQPPSLYNTERTDGTVLTPSLNSD
jgi:hypothetical protein